MKTYCIDWFEQELCECEGSEGYLVRAEDHDRAVEELQSRLESLEQEMQEQARMNGMGAERELRMATKMEKLDKDVVRYAFVKTMTKEMLLAWRGMYGCSDEAIDTAMQANKGE